MRHAPAVLLFSLVALTSFAQTAAPAVSPDPAPPSATALGIRWGASTGLGAFIPGPQLAWAIEGRIGVTVSPLFNAYARLGRQAGIGFGGTASSSGGSISVSASGFWFFGVNAELSLGDHFFVAGGPQLGWGGWAGVTQGAMASGSSSGASQSAFAASGFMPGLNAKIGFGTGSRRNASNERRGQFTMSVDLNLMYAPNTAYVNQSGGSGGASQSIGLGQSLGVNPMLMFGYDFR